MGARPVRPTRHAKTQHLVAAFVPALIVVLSITGFVWAQREVTVVVDGMPRHVRTQAATVGELLAEENIAVDADDVVNPSPESDLDRGTTVLVRHSVPVTLEVGDDSMPLQVVGETVADALIAAGLDPAGNPGVTPELNTPLAANAVISVPDVVVRVEQEHASVAPAVKRTRDTSLSKGTERVVSRGRPGRLLRVYRVLVSGGVETTPVLTAEQIVEKPEPMIIAVGAAPREPSATVVAASRVVPAHARAMRVLATGYSAQQPDLDDHTATGALARRGVVAVDPAVIPLGTRLYIPGYGMALAADTGGAIDGAHIDLCFDTVAEARAWGRRTVTVYVLK